MSDPLNQLLDHPAEAILILDDQPDRVIRIRSVIKSGTYENDAKLEAACDRLLDAVNDAAVEEEIGAMKDVTERDDRFGMR